ncbi:hypothetical protein HNV12_06560 [Methanococcoides sp. SA1]|nr:hypothetical protein [Methanococcoides sp. SA1]
MNYGSGGMPAAKYVYFGLIMCLVSVRYDFIPRLAELATTPVLDTEFGTLTVLSIYSGVCLAFLSAGAKGNLQHITDVCTKTTVTTVMFAAVLILGLLAAGDLFAAQVLEKDPFVLNTISGFLQDPISLEQLIRSNVDLGNYTFTNNSSGGEI